MGVWGSIKKAAKKVTKKAKKVAKVIVETVEENVDAVGSAALAPVDDVAGVVKHVAVGIGKVITGDTKGAEREFEKAEDAASEIASDVLVGPVGAALMVGGTTLSAVQQILGIEPESRGLTANERALLELIFEDSIDYDAIKIAEGNMGVLGLTSSVLTLGSKIRVPSSTGYVPLSNYPHVLVHEAVHIWQFEQGGPDYVAEALWSQQTGDGGNWLNDAGNTVVPAPRGYAFDLAVAAGKHWTDFNAEQQATLIHVAFQLSVDFANLAAAQMVFNGVNYSAELRNAVASIRSGEGTP